MSTEQEKRRPDEAATMQDSAANRTKCGGEKKILLERNRWR